AVRQAVELVRRQPQAAAADRAALAAAHRAGEPDPGDANAEAHEAELEKAIREATGLTDATLLAWQEFKAVFAEHAPRWFQARNAKKTKRAEALAATIESAKTSVAEVA